MTSMIGNGPTNKGCNFLLPASAEVGSLNADDFTQTLSPTLNGLDNFLLLRIFVRRWPLRKVSSALACSITVLIFDVNNESLVAVGTSKFRGCLGSRPVSAIKGVTPVPSLWCELIANSIKGKILSQSPWL
ncbi:MAG: hypothetical protein JW384_02545 [Nitrosomonadaceae bacterium]|nr:hypothetical protein [Nitrosomonadaceae bacterium]